MSSSTRNSKRKRETDYRFPIRRSIPPFEECHLKHEVKVSLDGLAIPPLQDVICSFLFEPPTNLQIGYDPVTQTILETDKQEYQETSRFFALRGFHVFEDWCWDRKQWKINQNRAKLALANLRFRVQRFARQYNIPSFSDWLPCQSEAPCLDDVDIMLCIEARTAKWKRDHLHLALTSPYLSARLCQQPAPPSWPFAINYLLGAGRMGLPPGNRSRDNSYHRYLDKNANLWKPDDFVEFLFRLVPEVMNSVIAYSITLYFDCYNDEFSLPMFNAFKKRLPEIDWKTADPFEKSRLSNLAEERSQEFIETPYQDYRVPPPLREFAQKVLTYVSS